MFDFKDKIVLITGGTSGIGEETARLMVESGAVVCINYSSNDNRAEKLREGLSKKASIRLYKADVSKEKQVEKMFSAIEKEFSHLDYLVNNVGIDIPDFIETYNIDNVRKIIDVNLIGQFICLKYAIPLLKKSSRPRVINVSSRLGNKPLEEASAYCCSKAGVNMLTKVAALELSKYGIRVNTVSPGFTRTPLTEDIFPTEDEWISAGSSNPSGRVGKPEDMANAVLFMLSEYADYINGDNLEVNGGSILK